MGTRCNITIKDGDYSIQLYRHFDGYPESIIPAFKLVEKFINYPENMNIGEFAAAIIIAWYDKNSFNMIDPKEWDLHSDIKYHYVVEPNYVNQTEKLWKITVYKINSDPDKPFYVCNVGDDYIV